MILSYLLEEENKTQRDKTNVPGHNISETFIKYWVYIMHYMRKDTASL